MDKSETLVSGFMPSSPSSEKRRLSPDAEATGPAADSGPAEAEDVRLLTGQTSPPRLEATMYHGQPASDFSAGQERQPDMREPFGEEDLADYESDNEAEEGDVDGSDRDAGLWAFLEDEENYAYAGLGHDGFGPGDHRQPLQDQLGYEQPAPLRLIAQGQGNAGEARAYGPPPQGDIVGNAHAQHPAHLPLYASQQRDTAALQYNLPVGAFVVRLSRVGQHSAFVVWKVGENGRWVPVYNVQDGTGEFVLLP